MPTQFVSKLIRTALLMAGVAVASVAQADPVWQETNNLASVLTGPVVYTSDLATRTGVATYNGQTATNTGATTERMGMYFGWNWSIDSQGVSTPLLWNGANSAFEGGGVSMKIARLDAATGALRIGDVAGDTWIGHGWSWDGTAPDVITEADWVVPFFDLGILAAGASTTYDIQITMTFADADAFASWNRDGSFYVGAQSVQLADVPEPGSLALVAAGLIGAAAAARRRRNLKA